MPAEEEIATGPRYDRTRVMPSRDGRMDTRLPAFMAALLVVSTSALGAVAPQAPEPITLFKGVAQPEPSVRVRWAPRGGAIATTGFLSRTEVSADQTLPRDGPLVVSGLLLLSLKGEDPMVLSAETSNFTWADDAKHIVQQLSLGPSGESRFYSIDVETGGMTPLLTVSRSVDTYTFSPDGGRIAYLQDDQQIVVADLTRQKPVSRPVRVPDDIHPYFVVWLGRTGQLLLNSIEGMCLVDPNTKAFTRLQMPKDVDLSRVYEERYVGADREGNQFAVAWYDASGFACIYLFRKGQAGWQSQRLTAAGRENLLAFPTFSPDGSRIAFVRSGAGGGGRYSLWVMPARGGDAVLVADDLQRSWFPAGFDWSPDGGYLAYADVRGSVRIVAAAK